MKNRYFLAILSLAIVLCAWGYKGHHAVATIAQNHLTPNVSKVVTAYLDGQTMEEVSTWADDHKNPTTASWHFVNLPLGLSHDAFVQAVQSGKNNIYTAIIKMEQKLKDDNTTTEEKNQALMYLIHFVGDAHQPMHVSRKEDKGGNTIQLRFDGKGTNLHALWDSKLIDHEGLSETDIAKQYDKANVAEIKKWQSDSPIEWLWESYQISTELYAHASPGGEIDEAYYQKYIPVIRKRINQAGIRLAGELNRLFASTKVGAVKAQSESMKAIPGIVSLKEAKNYIGSNVTVTGKAYTTKDVGSMVLVNLGAAYPKQLLTVVLKGQTKSLAASLVGRMVTVTGVVVDYQGKPEIIINNPDKISIQ